MQLIISLNSSLNLPSYFLAKVLVKSTMQIPGIAQKGLFVFFELAFIFFGKGFGKINYANSWNCTKGIICLL